MTAATEPDIAPLVTRLTAAAGARRPLRAIGAASAVAAKVAVETGFDALWVSGLEVSTALGLPDENVLGPRDLADTVLALTRTAALPVIVDIDNAGGTPATARRFAGDLTRAGAAALCLEDSAYPKVNSFALHRSQALARIETVTEQLSAMRDVAGTRVALIARTEALICGASVTEAVERAAAYAACGADAVLIHSKDPTGQQALATAAAWTGKVPLVTVPTAFPHLAPDELGLAGFALAIYANQLSRAALAAMRRAAASFQTTGSFTAGGTPLSDVADLLQIADPTARACL
ncbi:isocitrate lyase/phosphoenolpyruvate mutase family protein [Streptomyces sp. NBC_01571]|uniref:isocitrate lyase/phosphoenolpyruvate mutase family protein n=1 Tax=Streptomyces sp. NBC_01571 TaxID=2975883 RepID=UPI00225BBE9F|nr:isocitrate lyase/phosphoenolpyruvate mutase family protein [Streptomyces sp. NBC_01571]MCX4573419.1 isocitrate lyase/phosphoenolpyruvate mutase family protein [Streptomyces sp. NBC_01571]